MKNLLITAFLIYAIAFCYKQFNGRKIENRVPVQVEGIHTGVPVATRSPASNIGIASWYDRSACASRIYGVNCKTASGEIFDEGALTLACNKPIALGTRIRICRQGVCVIARCNDRGNFESLGRTFDFTPELFGKFAKPSSGVVKVTWEKII
jgi:rare lipoprotein A (peptidoglycan hydrolase)